MSLYNKYRPTSLEEFYGNKEVLQTLESMIDSGACPQTFLFSGPAGCGKTTLARVIANLLGCSENDLHEIDSAQFRGIDTSRELRNKAQFMPIDGSCSVWILDECHKMTNEAQNGMLKILEHPPAHATFILCTTEPDKLLKTVRSRCSSYELQPLSEKDMRLLLRSIVKEEGETLAKSIYQTIYESSQGMPRHAIQILEQVLNVPSEDRLEVAKKAEITKQESIKLCQALLKNTGWKEVREILRGLEGQEPEGIRRHILAYCKSVLLGGENDQAALIIENFWEPLYNTGFPGLVYCCYSIIKQ